MALKRDHNRGLHYTTCIKCGSLFLEPIPAKAEKEYLPNRGNPYLGLCAGCEGHKGTSRVRLVSSLRPVKIPDPDLALTDYGKLDGEWREWYEVAYRYSKRVPYADRPDITHDIMIELHKARTRDGYPLPELRAYRIASLTVALYWRKEAKRQVRVCLLSGTPKRPEYKACNFSHRPANCSECCYLAMRPFQSLESERDDGEGNTIELAETIADDTALDLPAWLDARTWLASAPYRLVEIANKRGHDRPLSHADRLYLSKWRKRAQKNLF